MHMVVYHLSCMVDLDLVLVPRTRSGKYFYLQQQKYMNFSFQLVVPWILEAVVFLYTGVFPKFLKHVKIS